jgi:hypothetical protein
MASAAHASPVNSSGSPAMISSSVDLPAPLMPTMPTLASGKKDSEMSSRISSPPGWVLERRRMW